MSSPYVTLVDHNDAAHRALERLFGRLAVVARGGSVPVKTLDAGIAAGVTLLTAHHDYEDELLVPRLKAAGASWVEEMSADHARLLALLGGLTAGRRGRADRLEELLATLSPHLALESSHLTEAGWRQLLPTDDEARAFGRQVAAHSRAHLKPASRLLPLLVYNLDEQERARFTERMPSFVVRGLVPYAFRPAWRSLRPFMTFPPPHLRPWLA